MRYRRANTEGASYFFTANLAERQRSLLTEHVDLLRESFKRVKQTHPFQIDAIVILPEHLHTIWTLPENDADFSTRWGLIKAGFSRALPQSERISNSRMNKGERGIWQRRFWEHLIRDEHDFEQHVAYIHYNPVKHGYVTRAADWQWTSIHRYIQAGIIPPDWANNDSDEHNPSFGERQTQVAGEERTPTFRDESSGCVGVRKNAHPNLRGLGIIR